MHSVVLCFLLLSMTCQGFQEFTREDIILETIRYMNKPLSITSFICWDKDEIINLSLKLFNYTGMYFKVSWPPNTDDLGVSLENAHHTLFIADLSCDQISSLLFIAESKYLFKSPYSWIVLKTSKANISSTSSLVNNNQVFDVCEDTLTIPEEMANLHLLVDSQVTFISNDNPIHIWCSYLFHKVSPGSEWKYEKVVKHPVKKSLAIQRKNLEGSEIRACYVLTYNGSINHLEDYKDSHIDTITKVNYILSMYVITFLNGSRLSTFQNSWGYKDSRGKWNGMMGELTTSRADIGGSPLFFTSDRVSEIDYIAMPTPTRSKFVFKQPKLSYMSNVFLLPFRLSIWLCSGVLVVLMVIALLIAAKVERNPVANTLKPCASDVVFMALGAMCQQGSFVSLRGNVGRIVILFLFLSLMFLYNSYSANIVALLQSSSSRIRTLSDLLNSRLRFAVHDTVFNRHYFSTETEPVRKDIYEKKIAPPGGTPRFIPLRDGIEKLREGLFAFHMEIGVGYKQVEELFYENEKCSLQEIQFLQVVDPWLAVQKNSSYKEMFKIGYRRIQEFGIQFRENWKFYTKKPRCSGSNSNFISVGIVDCLPAIKLLLYGFVFAIFTLFMEILFYKWKVKENKIRGM